MKRLCSFLTVIGALQMSRWWWWWWWVVLGLVSSLLNPYGITNSKGKPLCGGVKKYDSWMGKIRNFSQNLATSWKRYTIRPYSYCGTLTESHSHPIDPCQFRWPWVTLKSGTPSLSGRRYPHVRLLLLTNSDQIQHGNTWYECWRAICLR